MNRGKCGTMYTFSCVTGGIYVALPRVGLKLVGVGSVAWLGAVLMWCVG